MFTTKMLHSFFTSLLCLLLCNVSIAHIVTSGVTNGVSSGSAPPQRKNINDVANDQVTWSLLVQALIQLQAATQTDDQSYYGLGGIHGRPYRAWDNQNGLGRGNSGGYCTHNSILFPTWHRPYLAIYEQTLMTYVQKIAATYTDTKYQTAANNFRLPYWDWAASSSIPSSCSSQTVTILSSPSGAAQTVKNPLYSYTFHPLNSTDFPSSSGSLYSKTSTVRSTSANSCLANQNLKSTIYNLLSSQNTYSAFATQANSGASLESPHGTVHSCVGGHMGDIGYSGFDPLFWLHHANVDRMYALWQTIHYNSWFPSGGQVDKSGTFGIPAGSTETSSFPLPPFYQDSNAQSPWTSDNSRNVAVFGYTYPELVSSYASSASAKASAVTTAVNRLYGSSSSSSKKRSHTRDLWSLVSGVFGGSSRQWIISISVKKYSLPKTFNVYCFIGTPPADSSTWDSASNLAASMTSFVPQGDDVTPGPDDMMTYAELPINSRLIQAGLVSDLLPDVVTVFLKSKLTWRVRQVDGTVVEPRYVSGLAVSVSSKLVTAPKDDSSFPTYGDAVSYDDITSGKVNGGS